MPTVLKVDGFQIRIRLPPREHGPPHVHVWKAGAFVVIDLASGELPTRVRRVRGMRAADLVAAFQIVEGNVELLLKQWRKYHG